MIPKLGLVRATACRSVWEVLVRMTHVFQCVIRNLWLTTSTLFHRKKVIKRIDEWCWLQTGKNPLWPHEKKMKMHDKFISNPEARPPNKDNVLWSYDRSQDAYLMEGHGLGTPEYQRVSLFYRQPSCHDFPQSMIWRLKSGHSKIATQNSKWCKVDYSNWFAAQYVACAFHGLDCSPYMGIVVQYTCLRIGRIVSDMALMRIAVASILVWLCFFVLIPFYHRRMVFWACLDSIT